jgi:hypothetical protein
VLPAVRYKRGQDMRRTTTTLLLALIAVTITAHTAGARQFKKPVYYKLNDVPWGLVTADLNQDGNLDLAVAEFFTGQVGILLGKENGAFRPPRYFSVPGAYALTVGDFNGDHKLDLAVVQSGGTGYGALGIFLGDGKGNFHNSATYQLSLESTSVAVADFDGDGHLDLAVTNVVGSGKNGKDGSVWVFSGRGDGTFAKTATYELPGEPFSIAAGDFNGDGRPDLAVVEGTGNFVAILMNNGHGKFKLTETYATDLEPQCVVIADLDHNGTRDLVVGDLVGDITVFLGNGDGTFGSSKVYSASGGPLGVTVADFNRDGNPDIAVVVSQGDPVLLYGNGDGTFQSGIPIKVKNGSGHKLVAGDFNKDGAPDLAIDISITGIAVLINTQ